jgi:GNAT superfamily N-acetyltransferase
VGSRARAWHHAEQAAVCDLVSPWAHGTVLRSSLHPHFYDFNLVRVEDDYPLGVAALEAFANEALAGLAHRRVDFDVIAAAEPLRAALAAAGWTSMRLAWMRHVQPPSPATEAPATVEEVPYDAVAELRLAWHREELPEEDARFLADARAIAQRFEVRVLALLEDERPVGFAQLRFAGESAEITHVYVDPDHRGSGRGAAVTKAAIAACQGVRDLWICADDEGRPKQLYARLGFRPAWTAMEYQRILG